MGVAATIAHEMGHNFGMSHDSTGCCQARAEDGGCIMAAATGYDTQLTHDQTNDQTHRGENSRGFERFLTSNLFVLPSHHGPGIHFHVCLMTVT